MSIETKKCERCGKNKTMFSWDTLCWECQQDVELENIKNQIQTTEEGEEPKTCSNRYIICPYCGEANDSCDLSLDHPEIMIDGDHTITCQDCGEDFVVNSSVIYYFETYKIKQEEEEDCE